MEKEEKEGVVLGFEDSNVQCYCLLVVVVIIPHLAH